MIIYNLISGRKERLFPTESLIKAIKNKSDGIVCYTTQPLVFENTYELKNSQPSIVTVKKIWNFKSERYFQPSADCSFCGHRFEPPVSVLNTIGKITKIAGLKSHQSPCLDLPDEAWEEPGLLGECPDCHGKLKFNPFISGSDENSKTWMFWKK